MDSNVQTLDSKQAFRWKAAWFSFLAPLSCILIFFVFLLVQDHFAGGVQIWVFRFICVVAFFIQIIIVIMGVMGMYSKSVLVKVLAALGIVLSLIIGFFAFFSFNFCNLGILEWMLRRNGALYGIRLEKIP